MVNIYVINLDSDVKRLSYISEQLNDLNLTFNKVSAFDARNLSRERLDNQLFERCNINLTDNLGNSQVGCFISHYDVWKTIANEDDAYGLVLEDDVKLSPDLTSFLENEDWIPEEFDLIRLEVSTNRILLSKNYHEVSNRRLHQVFSTSWCAGAYIISKNCAQKLINMRMKSFRSADALLFSFEKSEIVNKLRIFQLTPALAIQDKYLQDSKGFESNIENHTFLNKIKWKILNNISRFSLKSLITKTIKGYQRVMFR